MQKTQRIGAHLRVEQAAEMGGADMADICQTFQRKRLRVMIVHIIQGGGQGGQIFILGAFRAFRWENAQQTDHQRQK